MSLSLDEKRKSLDNNKSDVLDARVVALYDDPGLREDYHWDLLSRFLIVFIESSYRIPTAEKWGGMFSLVLRPKQLWVDVEEGKSASPNTQKRSDQLGNVSVGLADSFTVAGIPSINYPYQMGEVIKIKRLASPLKVGDSTLFSSAFNENSESQLRYGNWHTEGSALAYFQNNQPRIDALKQKNIYQPFPDLLTTWGFKLYKEQYEAFFLNLVSASSDISAYATSLFENTLPNGSAEYSAQGGYIFNGLGSNTNNFINLTSCEFEDINVNGKTRNTASDCLPLVVATPNSFPTPRARTLSLISYNPSYATIVR